MDRPSVHPGPISHELLTLQAGHRSSRIWDGDLLSQNFRPRRIDEFWELIREHPLHHRTVECLTRTGIYGVIEVGRLQLDWSLITALIERWRPETHTFHLPTGEATITLQDVEVMFGLPIDGLAVHSPPAIREFRRPEYLQLLERLTGFRPAEETAISGVSRLQLLPVKQHLEALHEHITDQTSDEGIKQQSRLLLLMIFGGILFPNTSGNLVSLRFLAHLERLDDLPLYSWGGAVLAYLYRQLCRASMGSVRDVAGFLPLLQVWAWERFLQIQPPLRPLDLDAPSPPLLPHARRWVDRRGRAREVEARHHLLLYRDILDLLDGDQFVWRPYTNEIIASLPEYCSRGRAVWLSEVPLICLDIVEHHPTGRVLRQFGRPQHIPAHPSWHATHYERDDRGRVDQEYLAWLEARIEEWGLRLFTFPPDHPHDDVDVDKYMAWYHRVTRTLIGNPNHGESGRYIPYAGRHETLVVGLHRIHQMGLEMQQHVGDREALLLHQWGRQVSAVATATLVAARADARLDFDFAYIPPEDYHHGPDVPQTRGRRVRHGQRRQSGQHGRGGQRRQGGQHGRGGQCG